MFVTLHLKQFISYTGPIYSNVYNLYLFFLSPSNRKINVCMSSKFLVTILPKHYHNKVAHFSRNLLPYTIPGLQSKLRQCRLRVASSRVSHVIITHWRKLKGMVAFEWSPILRCFCWVSWKWCTWLANRNERQNDIARWCSYVHICKEEKYANKTQTFEHYAKRLNCFRLNAATRSITGEDTEKLLYLGLNLLLSGWKNAMPQAASRRPFTAEARPIHVGTVVNKVATDNFFSRLLWVSLVRIILSILRTLTSFIYQRRHTFLVINSVDKQTLIPRADTAYRLAVQKRRLSHHARLALYSKQTYVAATQWPNKYLTYATVSDKGWGNPPLALIQQMLRQTYYFSK